MEEVIQLIKGNTNKANLYGKLSAMYQIQCMIQKEIKELERQLENDEQE
tara:strand:- start:35 stop:181 length:147 start_codon:yes stop_codon:yes gene_type:complete